MALEDIRQGRIDKLTRLREVGRAPYPARFARSHTPAAAAALEPGVEPVSVGGRLRSLRRFGKLAFGKIGDIEGEVQIAIERERLGEEDFQAFFRTVDVGDFVGVTGVTTRTKTGEPTVAATNWVFLGKALLPMPEKWHGVSDTELCYRQRHLDLISDEQTRKRFLLRSRLIQLLRQELEREAFIEVDTPVLCNKPSGALARPFHSHHNALDMPVALRIAPETYLKRCVVGGFDRVYEFARCFRNEGIDASHLQDFTMLEFYAAYWDYEDNMAFTERLLQRVLAAVDAEGVPRIVRGGRTISFAGPFPRVDFTELVTRETGIDLASFTEANTLRAAIAARGIALETPAVERLGLGNLIDALYKRICRPLLVEPTFLIGHPLELSPLARQSDTRPALADRFQLVVDGWEVVNAYSELVDPLEQRRRLEQQAAARAGGDEEAMELDGDYLLAMEHGMPPISGWGMGIDRFVALVSDVPNLKDVVLFPLLRPEPPTTP